MRKARSFYGLVASLIAVIVACSDLPAPTALKPEQIPGSSRSVSLGIKTDVIYLGSPNSRPINFLKARVYNLATNTVLASKDEAIDAGQSALSIPLNFTLTEATSANIKVTLELTNQAS